MKPLLIISLIMLCACSSGTFTTVCPTFQTGIQSHGVAKMKTHGSYACDTCGHVHHFKQGVETAIIVKERKSTVTGKITNTLVSTVIIIAILL